MSTATTIADLLLRQGQSNANRVAQQGQIWGTALSNVGQQIASIPAQQQQQRAMNQRNVLGDLQIQEARTEEAKRLRTEADVSAVDSAMQSGGADRKAVIDKLSQSGRGHLVPQLIKQWDEADSYAAKAQKAHQEADESRNDYFASLASGMKALATTPDELPAAFNLMLDHAEQKGYDTTEERALAQQQPQQLPRVLDALIARSHKFAPKPTAAPKGFSLSPGMTRFDEYGSEIASVPPADKAEKVAPVGSFENYVETTYGKTPTPAQILAARKAYGQADDRAPRITVNAGGEKLSPDAVDYTATQYRILGPTGIPTRLSDQEKIPIINAAAKQVKALGQSPAAAIQKQFAFKSDAASLTKLTTMADAAASFETKANAQAQLVADLSGKVNRTQFPIINDVLLSGKERVMGDENTHLFTNALLTFTSEYAKLMEGSTGSVAGSSESTRRDAARLVSTALNKGTILKTVAQMQWEMQQTIMGYDVTKKAIAERMGGTSQTTPPQPALLWNGTELVPNPNYKPK